MKKIHTYIMACLITTCHFSHSMEPDNIEGDALSLLFHYETEMKHNRILQDFTEEYSLDHRFDDVDHILHVLAQIIVLFF